MMNIVWETVFCHFRPCKCNLMRSDRAIQTTFRGIHVIYSSVIDQCATPGMRATPSTTMQCIKGQPKNTCRLLFYHCPVISQSNFIALDR